MYKVIFPTVLGLLSLTQLYACLREKEILRMLSKVLLMPLLALCWLIFSHEPSALVLSGILLGGLGDLALLWPLKKGSFLAGELAFLAGHFCYLAYILGRGLIAQNIWLPLIISLLYLSGCTAVYLRTRREIPPVLRPSSLIYMLALAALSACTLLVLISRPGTGSALAFAGATLFLISDGILSQMLFIIKKESGLINFIVMLSYIAAQCLLCAGWILG